MMEEEGGGGRMEEGGEGWGWEGEGRMEDGEKEGRRGGAGYTVCRQECDGKCVCYLHESDGRGV